jgi:hypothetical protein
VGLFPLRKTFPADDAFVSETGAHVVEGGAGRGCCSGIRVAPGVVPYNCH